jgi:hypothetical protein
LSIILLPMFRLSSLLGFICENLLSALSGPAMFVAAASMDLRRRRLGRLISLAIYHSITPGSILLPIKPPVLSGVPEPRNFRQFKRVESE